MKCPHCNVAIYANTKSAVLSQEDEYRTPRGDVVHSGTWNEIFQRCPECGQTMIWVERVSQFSSGEIQRFLVYPKGINRPIPSEVPDPYRQDFSEACLVLTDSPKASAALSRRCLQMVLKDKGGAKKRDLADQIDEIAASLPSHIAGDLHAVRNIGNFAAHPQKSTNTGEIMDVESEEAEWNLDVLELLFDFYFVQPAISAKRRATLNARLKEAGKPELK